MKIKIGAIITEATGKLGGSTIAKNNGVLVMKNKNAHRLQSTNKQQIQRARTQYISSSWSQLTDEQRANFSLQTDFYSKANFYSDNARFTSFGLFKLLNQNRLQLNLSLLTYPNETHRPTFPQGVNVEASTDEIIVSSDLYNSDDIVLLYGTRSLQKGIRRPHRYLKFICSVTASELATGIDIKTMYEDVFTPLQENDNFFIATKTVSKISYFSNALIIANENPCVVNGNSGFDPDAQAFIDAVGTLTLAQQNAINDLVLGFKSNGTWSKYHAIYPYVGGTANAHKYNLKDPRDLDDAFRITWYGSLTHDSNGVTGDGLTGYGDTHYIASNHQTPSYSNSSIYCVSNNTWIASDAKDLGVFQSQNQSQNIVLKNPSNRILYRRDDAQKFVSGITTAAGFTTVTRNGTTSVNVLKNGVLINTQTNGTPNPPTRSAYLFNTNYNGPYSNGFSNQTHAFATFGEGLTNLEAVNDYTVIQAYQTALNRNV